MLKHTTKLLLSLSFTLTLVACIDSGTDSDTGSLIIDTPCEVDADCPGGFECEVEEEHGTITSFCKAHGGDGEDADPGQDGDPGDPGCPDGYELEIEHGQQFCVPHGGDDSGDDN